MLQEPTAAWLLTVLCAGVALYCGARCRFAGSGREERRLDASAALMGVAMAVMAAPVLGSDRLPTAGWLAVMGLGAVWAVASSARSTAHRRHHAEHAVGYLAMAYMAAAMGSSGPVMRPMAGMDAMAPPMGLPWLTGVLACYFVLSALVNGVRVMSLAPAGGHHQAFVGAPLWARPTVDACHTAMALAMAVMLMLM